MTKPSPALVVPMRRSLLAFAATLVATPVVAWITGQVTGSAAGWAVLLGLLVPVFFFGITILAALATAAKGPGVMAGAVLGSWLVKLSALIGFLYWLEGQDFYAKPVFFGCFVTGTIALLVAEAAIVQKARVPRIDL